MEKKPTYDELEEKLTILERDWIPSKQAQERQQLAIRLIGLLNQAGNKDTTIRDILGLIQEFTEYEAVGIRLEEEEDFPYYETKGFTREFVKAERSLCPRDNLGEILCDADGRPILECMCGNVIRGRTDPDLSFFTEGGSFWSNCTTKLLEDTTEEDRQGHTRNRCNGEGYESVALIPLKAGDKNIGLLQLNDKRKNVFSLEDIKFFEGIGASIAVAFQRKKDENAIRRSEQFLSAIFDSIQDGISVLDSEFEIVRVNHEMRRKYHYVAPLEGKKCYEAYHGRSEPCDSCPSIRAFETGNLEVEEVPLIQEGREQGTLELLANPMFDNTGKPIGVVEYIRDITKRKKAEQTLREQDRLQSVLEIAGAICHELSQPMQAVTGYSQLLLMNTHGESHYATTISKINEQIGRMGKITEKLMGISRYETKDSLENKIIDLDKAADKKNSEYQKAASE